MLRRPSIPSGTPRGRLSPAARPLDELLRLGQEGLKLRVIGVVRLLHSGRELSDRAACTGTAATTKLNRQDFGISWSRTLDGGGLVVSDEVAVTIDIELVSAPPSSK